MKHAVSCIYWSNDSYISLQGRQEGATVDCVRQKPPVLQLGSGVVLPMFDLDSEPAQFFPFLLEFTKDISLPHSFENAIVVVGPTAFADETHLQSQLNLQFDQSFFDLDSWSSGFANGDSLWSISPPALTASVPYAESVVQRGDSWQEDALRFKSSEVAVAVGPWTATMQPDAGILLEQADPTGPSHLGFFSPLQLRRYLDLYWEKWYPNWPTIHRPLFNPFDRSGLLVAAMAVIGACHSNDPEERTASKFWARAVEEWASKELESMHLASTRADLKNSLGTIQAACIICIYQNWNGAVDSKRRMRRGFFSAVVGVCSIDFSFPLYPHVFDAELMAG